MKFQWDFQKAIANLEKHRVSFEEALTIFGDPLASTILNSNCSTGEIRFVTLGLSKAYQLIVVFHTEPDVAQVFPDSASVNEALRLLTKIARTLNLQQEL